MGGRGRRGCEGEGKRRGEGMVCLVLVLCLCFPSVGERRIADVVNMYGVSICGI